MNKKMTLEVGDKLVYIGGENINGGTYTDGQEYEVVSVAGTSGCVTNNNNAHVWWGDFAINYNFKKVEKVMYKKGDKLLRTGGSNQFYKKGKEYGVIFVNGDGEWIKIENEMGDSAVAVKDIQKFFELVVDDSVPPYQKGDEIVFTDIENVGGASRAILTVGKVYEVLEWRGREGDRYVEHFIIKNNNGKEFVVRYDEFKYVKKLKELESEMYIRIAPSNHTFNIGEKYEGVECGDYIIFNLNDEGRKQSYTKSSIHEYFEKCSPDTDIHEYKHRVKIGDRFIRTGFSGSMFERGRIYSVYRVDVGGAWLVGDNGQQGFYVFSMLNNPEYFMRVDESEFLREELEIKEKEIESKDKEIAALKATISILQPLPVGDVNQERKIVIHRAKEFVREHLNQISEKPYDYDIIRTESRRMVTVLLKEPGTGKLLSKGQSICAKGDVFNLYIGRAIALGRALGIDVSYFENAVQPELAIGQIVKVKEDKWYDRRVVEKIFNTEQNSLKYLKRMFNDGQHSQIKIISDTDAQY